MRSLHIHAGRVRRTRLAGRNEARPSSLTCGDPHAGKKAFRAHCQTSPLRAPVRYIGRFGLFINCSAMARSCMSGV